jgi:hypothetical protein
VGFVVGHSGAGQVFSEFFGFPCNRRSLHQLLHNHPGTMYHRPICGRSTGAYTNLGDLQRDLRGLSPTPPNKKKNMGIGGMEVCCHKSRRARSM